MIPYQAEWKKRLFTILKIDDYKTARRFDGYWEVMGPVPCSGSNTAPIYDVRGSLVGWARIERSQRLRIIDPGNLVGGPKWVVVGDCAIKLL